MDDGELINKVIKSNIEINDEKAVRKKSYTYIVVQGNNKQNDIRTESSHIQPIHNDDVSPNLYISNDAVNMWRHYKPSNM